MSIMGNSPGWTDKAAAQAADTIVDRLDHRFPGIFIKPEDIGRADVDTEPAAATRLVTNFHLQHDQPLLTLRIISPFTVISTSSSILPTAWVEQARHGS